MDEDAPQEWAEESLGVWHGMSEFERLAVECHWANRLRVAETVEELITVVDMVDPIHLGGREKVRAQVLAHVERYMRMGQERNGDPNEKGAVLLTISAMLARPGYAWLSPTKDDRMVEKAVVRLPKIDW